jgi:hypothetical protein
MKDEELSREVEHSVPKSNSVTIYRTRKLATIWYLLGFGDADALTVVEISSDGTEEPLTGLAKEPSMFRVIALALPRRLWEEDLGDALEVLEALAASGAPRWQRWAKIWSTCFWLIPGVVREWTSAWKGNPSSESQRRGGGR